jgi:hypothetical protein
MINVQVIMFDRQTDRALGKAVEGIIPAPAGRRRLRCNARDSDGGVREELTAGVVLIPLP